GKKEKERRKQGKKEVKKDISEAKINKLIEKRKKEKVNAKERTLRNFIVLNKLENYLPRKRSNEYTTVKEFNIDMKNVYRKRVLTDKRKKAEKWSFEEALAEIFDYDKFSNYKKERADTWDAYHYTKFLNLEVCPYCDRQFVQTFIKEGKRTRAVLDHFYSKSIYPYLAISIFNLIPCCHICNSTFKGNIDLYNNEIIYPFEEEFKKNVEFRINGLDFNSLIGLEANFDIEFEILTKDKLLIEKINKTIELFALKDVYWGHHVYIKNLYRYLYINNASRINEILEKEKDLFSSKEELERLLFLGMNEESNIGKHVLSKLSFDIIRRYRL
ncbi:hypothetical protein, partial [Planomicrobium sp. MB-3u-38]|uniref:hypothetical protein n=1 Tax=Planomicrobium sp. MB-3u-38 TaxID=2058318 RepID=UPI000C7A2EAE